MMMTNRAWARTAGLVLVLIPVAACAKPVEQAPAAQQARPAATGTTLAEFQKRHAARLMAADTDGDGRVSQAEYLANAKAGKHDPAGRFAKWDRNGDGYLDKAEIDAMLAKRFARLDADHDGVVSAQERSAHAAKGKPAGDGAEP